MDRMEKKKLLDRFTALWEAEDPFQNNGLKRRADKWGFDAKQDAETARRLQERLVKRIASARDFLTVHGALASTFHVLDVGAGPLHFTNDFATTVCSVTGLDHSEFLLEAGLEESKRRGLTNVRTCCADFRTADIPLAEKGYDLVFSSITPAVGTVSALRKMNQLSRNFCFNSSFLETRNEVRDRIQETVFGTGLDPSMHGERFYALWNMLWLSGYKPVVGYYTERMTEPLRTDAAAAHRMAEEILLRPVTDVEVERTRVALEELLAAGQTTNVKENTYGYILWQQGNQIRHNPPSNFL
ncbi:MAG: class I SAM-dependent methyltransferase [Eubacteriales bacterium]|nr:class I SAM-dependent methyltransferase [Eubacteriales bacterium]